MTGRPGRGPGRAPGSTLVGARMLLGHDLRRDRVLVASWLAALALTAYASARATRELLGPATDQAALAAALDDQPGIRALYGPVLDPTSSGELAMSKLTVLYALVSAILYVVLVRRHTRVEEESGRAELVAGAAVGRDAPLAAVVVECCLVATALGLLVCLADVAGGLDPSGAAWFGVTWWGTGLVATGVGAVACQVSASARTCGAVAAGALVAVYAVRAVGDSTGGLGWLSWVSPLGWNTRLRAWSEPRWWVALLYVALAVVLVAAAQVMRDHRDLGGGLVGARPGPTVSRLGGVLALTVRLHRAPLVLWTLGTGVTAGFFAALAPGLDDLLRGTGGEALVDRLGGTFLAALLPLAALAVTCFAVSVVGGAQQDESSGRAVLLLAAATSRARWTGATALVACAGATWLLLVAGTCLCLGFTAAGGAEAAEVVPGALSWAPAVWVMSGVAQLGHAARLAWLGWAALLLAAALTLVGELLDLPRWVTTVSPYSAVPGYPAEAWSWTPVLVLSALAVAVTALARRRLGRRDVG